MAKAMLKAYEKGAVLSSTIKESAHCILLFNDLIDVLDSNQVRARNTLKSALSRENIKSLQILENSLLWIPTLRVKTKKGNLKILHCFKGLEMTVRGIMELFAD